MRLQTRIRVWNYRLKNVVVWWPIAIFSAILSQLRHPPRHHLLIISYPISRNEYSQESRSYLSNFTISQVGLVFNSKTYPRDRRSVSGSRYWRGGKTPLTSPLRIHTIGPCQSFKVSSKHFPSNAAKLFHQRLFSSSLHQSTSYHICSLACKLPLHTSRFEQLLSSNIKE
jgi:hypothetical protein